MKKRNNEKIADANMKGIVRVGNSLFRILNNCKGDIFQIQPITNVCDCCGQTEAVHTYHIEPEDCGDGDTVEWVGLCDACLASP